MLAFLNAASLFIRSATISYSCLMSLGLLLANPIPVTGGDVNDSLLQDLKDHAIPKWEEASKILGNIECHIELRLKKPVDGEPKTIDIMELQYANQSEMNLRLVSAVRPTQKTAYRRAVNPAYHFQVGWNEASEVPVPSAPVSLLSAVPRVPGENDPAVPLIGSVRNSLESGIRVIHAPIIELLDGERGFHLEAVRSITNGSAQRIRVEFLCVSAHRRNDRVGAKYWAEVAPEHSWMVERSGILWPDGTSESSECLAFQLFEGIPVPERIEFTVKSVSGEASEAHEYIIKAPELFTRKADEFYLPYYGISEDVLKPVSADSGHFWLIVVNVAGALLFLFYLLYLQRKREDPR